MTDTADRLYERMLVLRCQAGSQAAFVELVERFGPRLRYYLRKMLGPHGEVEDAMQEVWLDMLRGIDRLVDASAFPAWLYRIARNRALQRLQKPIHGHVPLGDPEVIAERQGQEVFSADDVAQVNKVLDELPAEHREVLVLRFMEEMSYEQIAAVTTCELGTVRSRLHYAKIALRRLIERMDDHER